MRESSLNQINTDQIQPETIQALMAQVKELSKTFNQNNQNYLTRQDV
jgi:hypothetical protein